MMRRNDADKEKCNVDNMMVIMMLAIAKSDGARIWRLPTEYESIISVTTCSLFCWVARTLLRPVEEFHKILIFGFQFNSGNSNSVPGNENGPPFVDKDAKFLLLPVLIVFLAHCRAHAVVLTMALKSIWIVWSVNVTSYCFDIVTITICLSYFWYIRYECLDCIYLY